MISRHGRLPAIPTFRPSSRLVALTPAARTIHRGGRNAGSSASQRGQETTRIAADLVELPRSEKSLSELTLRSTSLAKEALLSTSTASSWSPPAWPRAPGLWWCKHRDRRDADAEDEDDGEHANP